MCLGKTLKDKAFELRSKKWEQDSHVKLIIIRKKKWAINMERRKKWFFSVKCMENKKAKFRRRANYKFNMQTSIALLHRKKLEV